MSNTAHQNGIDKINSHPKQGEKGYGAIDNNTNSSWKDDDDDDVVLTSGNMKMDDRQQHSMVGIFFIMVGSFSFSVMFLLVKLMEGKANSFTLVFYRSLVQIALSLSGILRQGENPLGQLGGGNRCWLLVRGGFGAGAVIAWFYGIQHLPLPDAVTLQFTTPVFAALFAVALVGEEWKRLDMIGAVVCLMGVCLIAHPTWLFGEMNEDNVADDDADDDDDALMTTSVVPSLLMEANATITPEYSDDAGGSGGGSSSHQGIAVAVTTAGAAMAGLAYVSVRLISGTSANVMVLYYASISIPIVLCGSYGLLDKWRVWEPDTVDSPFSLGDYFLLLLTGFAGYGGQFFTNLGLQREQAATGTLATSTQIVWTYIFEMMFLHEGINGWSLAGTGLILGFMVIVGISKVAESNHKDNDDASSKTKNTTEESDMLLAQSDEVLC